MVDLQPRSPGRRASLLVLFLCLAALVVFGLQLGRETPPKNNDELEKLCSHVEDLQTQVERLETTTNELQRKIQSLLRVELLLEARTPQPVRPTAVDALKKSITVIFPRRSLEAAMQTISDEIRIPIVIFGPDLQLEGITKNQSFGLDERNQPARDILRRVLKKSSPDGKLAIVIREAANGDEQLVLTTKSAAARRGEQSLQMSGEP